MKINNDLLPIVVSAEEPVGAARKAIWKRHSKNLFDPSLAIIYNNTSFSTASIPSESNNSSVSINSNNIMSGTANNYLGIGIPFHFENGRTIYNVGSLPGARHFLIHNLDGTIKKEIGGEWSYTPDSTFDGYLGLALNNNTTVNGLYIMYSYDPNATYEPYRQDTEYFLDIDDKYSKAKIRTKKYERILHVSVSDTDEHSGVFNLKRYDHLVVQFGERNQYEAGSVIIDLDEASERGINTSAIVEVYSNSAYNAKLAFTLRSDRGNYIYRMRQLTGWSALILNVYGVWYE